MFRGSYQKKLLTVLHSGGSNPLEIWNIHVRNGWTRRVKDDDLGTIVFEIAGTNVATAYIVSPPDPRGALAISLPFITMVIKNLKRYFTFEIQILDDKNMRRRFRFSNYQSATKVRPFTCSVPLALKPGWNQMQLNLANFTTRAYGTNYVETQRVQLHANCRVRRIYFSDRLYAEEELPRDYRIHLNVRQMPQQHPAKDVPTGVAETGQSSILKRSSLQSDGFIPPEVLESVAGRSSYKSIPSVDHPPSKVDSDKTSQIQMHESSHRFDKMERVLSKDKVPRSVSKLSRTSHRSALDTTKSVTFEAEFQEEVLEKNALESTNLHVEEDSDPQTDFEEAPEESVEMETPRMDLLESDVEDHMEAGVEPAQEQDPLDNPEEIIVAEPEQ